MANSLLDIARSISSAVGLRLFAEYGAVFVTKAIAPPAIIFRDPEEVDLFQSKLSIGRATFGEHEIELQSAALGELARARDDVANNGGLLTARAADAGRRSFEDTVRLWNRNVTRGLDYWQAQGRIAPAIAEQVKQLSPVDQVAAILEMEDAEQIYFGTYFNRSILYSVAAPGASQHLSLLAFDVAEYANPAVEETLNSFGWYRTVLHDLPHFTYLGHAEDTLERLGLKRVGRDYDDRTYFFWVPAI